MPTYDFECPGCHYAELEVLATIHDTRICPRCYCPMERLFPNRIALVGVSEHRHEVNYENFSQDQKLKEVQLFMKEHEHELAPDVKNIPLEKLVSRGSVPQTDHWEGELVDSPQREAQQLAQMETEIKVAAHSLSEAGRDDVRKDWENLQRHKQREFGST